MRMKKEIEKLEIGMSAIHATWYFKFRPEFR